MNLIVYISDFIVPFLILAIVVYGILKGINVYDTFITGARSGFLTVIRLMPTLIGLMAAVGILRASGFLDFLASVIGTFSSRIGFSRGTGPPDNRKNVFLLRCHRTAPGHL